MNLSERLRLAALERARAEGHDVDGVAPNLTGMTVRGEEHDPASSIIDTSLELPYIGDGPIEGDLAEEALPEAEAPLPESPLWKGDVREVVQLAMIQLDVTAETKTDTADTAEEIDDLNALELNGNILPIEPDDEADGIGEATVEA